MRRKDMRKLKEESKALLGMGEHKRVEQAETEDGTVVYLLDGVISLARRDDILFPTLVNPIIRELPSVVVDMGAVPYVCNGADVMAPGIVEVKGKIEEGELVVIKDIRHGKALAVGMTLFSSEEIREMNKGKVIKNLHNVGDRIWKTVG
jgi:PUA-domain protein